MLEKPKIGTSGYSYPGPSPKGWFGVFYPKTKGKRFDAQEYYSQFFDTVEINSSFYGPPTPAMAEAWVRKTLADFEFSVKLWQKFTHPKKIGQESDRGVGAHDSGRYWTRDGQHRCAQVHTHDLPGPPNALLREPRDDARSTSDVENAVSCGNLNIIENEFGPGSEEMSNQHPLV